MSNSDAPKLADERDVRHLYEQLLQRWEQGAEAYAECFSQDAIYIVGTGMIENGWNEIVEGHEIIFSAWARNSRLRGTIDEIRFLSPAIAIVVAHGNIEYKDHRSSELNTRTVYTLIAQKREGGWIFVHYQNTPILKH